MCGIDESSRRRGFADFANPNSHYKLPTSHVVSLPHIKIPKPTSQKITRNEEAEMRAWGKMHGKSVRQRNVRQDNTMDRAGTLPLNLYVTSQAKTFRTLSRFYTDSRSPAVHHPFERTGMPFERLELTVLKNSSAVRTARAIRSRKFISRLNG